MESLEDCAAEYAELEHRVRKTREQIAVRQSHLEADRHDLARLEPQLEQARARLIAATRAEQL